MPNNLQNEEVSFKSGKRLLMYIIHIYNHGSNPGLWPSVCLQQNIPRISPFCVWPRSLMADFQEQCGRAAVTESYNSQGSLRSHTWASVLPDSG